MIYSYLTPCTPLLYVRHPMKGGTASEEACACGFLAADCPPVNNTRDFAPEGWVTRRRGTLHRNWSGPGGAATLRENGNTARNAFRHKSCTRSFPPLFLFYIFHLPCRPSRVFAGLFELLVVWLFFFYCCFRYPCCYCPVRIFFINIRIYYRRNVTPRRARTTITTLVTIINDVSYAIYDEIRRVRINIVIIMFYSKGLYNIRFVVRKTRHRYYECLTVHPGMTNRAHARRHHHHRHRNARHSKKYHNVC